MFNSKKKTTPTDSAAYSSAAPSGSSNNITAGTTIIGDITANHDIRIDGTLEGTLDCQGRVIIGPSGAIQGKITCQNAVIEGKFKGDLTVKELLNVKDSAEITGDIKTDKLLVQSGALFNVTCAMGGQIISSFDSVREDEPLSFAN